MKSYVLILGANMARLFRLSRLNDRFNTQVFTFQIPASILKENSPDVCSREFSYGYQEWSILLIRYPKHIGIYLNLHNVLEGVTSMVDYTFTLVNNDHFTKNEVLVERGCSFTQEKSTHGRKSFMGVGDLTSRGFMHENGEFLMELELRNAHTRFDQVLQLPREGKDTGNGYSRVESSYFSFGGFDWSLLVFPNGDRPENDGHGLIRLVRQTKFDHVCKVKYQLVMGYGDRLVDSEKMEHYVDITGTGTAYEISYSLYSLTSSKSRIHLKLDLVTVNAISEVVLYPLNRSKNRGHLYDVEKQAWILESDISRSNLKFRLFYEDIREVPRNCLRHVTFGVTVLPSRGHHARSVEAVGSPFSEYFSQNDPDDSSDIPTEITSESLMSPGSGYLEGPDQKLRVQVEWMETHILHHERYHKLDDTTSKHKHQMLREIMALQAENYALEKQVHSYQVSIAKNNAKDKEEPTPRDGYSRRYKQIPNHHH